MHLNPAKYIGAALAKQKFVVLPWSDDLLTYHLQKSANHTTREKRLIKITIGEIRYDLKLKSLKNII